MDSAQPLLKTLGQISHLIEGSSQPAIHPVPNLLGAIGRRAETGRKLLKVSQGEIGNAFLLRVHAIDSSLRSNTTYSIQENMPRRRQMSAATPILLDIPFGDTLI